MTFDEEWTAAARDVRAALAACGVEMVNAALANADGSETPGEITARIAANRDQINARRRARRAAQRSA